MTDPGVLRTELHDFERNITWPAPSEGEPVMPDTTINRKRTLSDSEARWEAVMFIDQAVVNAVQGGVVGVIGDDRGWTEDDIAAVEQHALARADGLIRRPRKARPSR